MGNLFQSPLFQQAFAAVTGTRVELYHTDGAVGAARGAGLGAGIFAGPKEAFQGLEVAEVIEPDPSTEDVYRRTYAQWKEALMDRLEP
jgi:xylulokinase